MTDSTETPTAALSTAPEWRLEDLPPLSCPLCGYDLTTNPVPTCPECGYNLTHEDIKLNSKRLTCLEITKYSAVHRHLFLGLAVAIFVPYIGLFLAAIPVLSVFALTERGMKGVTGRLRRRIWLMSAAWLHVPWIVCGFALEFYDWTYWRYFSATPLIGLLPDELMDLPDPVLILTIAALFIGGIVLRRRSLLKLAVATGLNPADGILRWNTAATRVSLIPYLIPFFLVLIWGLLWTLDTFWPNWA